MRLVCGAWLSPVERTVRVREVPSSNLGAPTEAKPPFDVMAVLPLPGYHGFPETGLSRVLIPLRARCGQFLINGLILDLRIDRG
jgi:hypothetical protein